MNTPLTFRECCGYFTHETINNSFGLPHLWYNYSTLWRFMMHPLWILTNFQYERHDQSIFLVCLVCVSETGFLDDVFYDSISLGPGFDRPYQFNPSVREPKTIQLYKHLNLKSCIWTFDAYYDMTELIDVCGGSVTADFQVRTALVNVKGTSVSTAFLFIILIRFEIPEYGHQSLNPRKGYFFAIFMLTTKALNWGFAVL